jgi:calcium permeable stress-gated cation channel
MAITHVVWRYNLIYVVDSTFDSKGLFYPRALTHLTVGLYLACFCLLGLFLVNTAFGPGVLMALFLVVSAMVHFTLVRSVAPLLQNLPQTLSLEEEIQADEKAAADASAAEGHNSPEAGNGGLASSYYDMEEALGEEDMSSDSETDDASPPAGSRAVEGASEARSVLAAWFMDMTKRTAKENIEALGLKPERDPDAPPSFLDKWLNPHLHEDFIAIRKNIMTLPDSPPEPASDDLRQSYHPPEMWEPKPILWIPKDEARVSRQEVAHTRECTPITDKGATMDENGVVTVDVEAAPFALPRLLI